MSFKLFAMRANLMRIESDYKSKLPFTGQKHHRIWHFLWTKKLMVKSGFTFCASRVCVSQVQLITFSSISTLRKSRNPRWPQCVLKISPGTAIFETQ